MTVVSVIIPTRNAVRTLIETLRSLEASDFEKSRFEVIVVDDGSTDDTESQVAAFRAASGLDLKYLKHDRTQGGGPGLARNDGLKVASGRVIAFTDADCIVDKGWLTAVRNHVIEMGETLVGGETWCEEVLLFPWKMSPAGQRGITANLAVDREKTEGFAFAHDFAGLLGDDTDYVNRLVDAGHPLHYAADMRVLHPARCMTLKQIMRRSLWRQNEVLLFKRYGKRWATSAHPFFRPRFFGRFSSATVVVVGELLFLTAAIVQSRLLAPLLIAITLATVAFVLRLYRFCITYVPSRPWHVSVSDRIKTLVFTVIYLPCFVVARIIGSWKQRIVFL